MWGFLKRRKGKNGIAEDKSETAKNLDAEKESASQTPDPPDDDDGGEPPSGEERRAPEGANLADITRGLLHAASAANQMVAHQYMRILDQFFDVDESGNMQAKIVELSLDDKHTIEMPLVTLVAPRGMAMERMKVELAVRTNSVEKAESDGDSGLDKDIHHFKVSMAPVSGKTEGRERDTRFMNIEIEFVAQQPPEGMMRVIDEYTNRVMPKPIKSEGERS